MGYRAANSVIRNNSILKHTKDDMRRKYSLLIASAILFFCSSESAFATGFLVPGFSRTSTSTFDTFDSPDTIGIPAVIDNSYYCRAVVSNGLTEFFDFASNLGGLGSPSLVFRGSADGLGNNEGAFSFIANGTGSAVLSVDANTSGSGGGARAILQCFNTTLFGNFNTVNAANPVNFLEIKNIGTTSLNLRIILRSFTGVELTRFTQTLEVNERKDIAVHTLTNAANTFGGIQIAHDGSLGAVVANVSKYQLNGSNLTITATESLRERVQN